MQRALLVLPILIASSSLRASPQESPLDHRASEVAALIRPDPAWPADLFHPEFLKEVPPARLGAIFQEYHRLCGRVEDVVLLEQKAEFTALFRFDMEKDLEVVLTLLVDPKPPHAITGLLLQPPTPALPSLEAFGQVLSALPGSVSFLAVRLGGDEPKTIFERDPDRRLGVGSSFKLYVLGRLVQDVAEKKRAWSDAIPLDRRYRSLPSGFLQTWPEGAPVTLHSLACLMISQSDNTATDHLIHVLGRERVEAMLAAMGHGEPARNAPLLMTSELFRIRGIGEGEHASEFVALDEAGRRKYLAETIAPLPVSEVNPIALALPTWNDRLEWFASTRDLCRAADWLRRATEAEATRPARDVLAIQPGTSVAGLDLDYVGYKGGSTGGVLNHTWLLRTKRGTWLAVSATWNDTSASLDMGRFGGLVHRALVLIVEGEAASSTAREGAGGR